MPNEVSDLQALVTAGRAAVAHDTERVTQAKQAAIVAMTTRQPVEVLVTAKLLTVDDQEVIAVRQADAEARDDLTAARQALSSAERDLANCEQALADAQAAVEHARRMAILEHTSPELLAELGKARQYLDAVEFVAPGRTNPEANGKTIYAAKARVKQFERALGQALAEVPDGETTAPVGAGAVR